MSKLWHQSLVDFTQAPEYKRALQDHAARVARPGTEVDVHGVLPGTYGDWPTAVGVKYIYLMHWHKLQLLENVLRAAREGYDAFLIVTLQDPALREARSLVDIPVVGYGEAAMHVACMLGDRFGIVAFNRPLFPLWQEQIEAYGLARRAVPIVEVEADYAAVVRAYDQPEQLIGAFENAARASLALGADVIIPGQSIVGQALASNGITRIDDAPIIDPLAVTIKLAEVMVDLQQVCGMGVTRRGYYYERPPAALIAATERFYQEHYGADSTERT